MTQSRCTNSSFSRSCLPALLLMKLYGEEKTRKKVHELMEKDWGTRVIGLTWVLMAVVFGYGGAYTDICKVLRREDHFWYSAGGVFIIAFAAIAGIILLIVGSRWRSQCRRCLFVRTQHFNGSLWQFGSLARSSQFSFSSNGLQVAATTRFTRSLFLLYPLRRAAAPFDERLLKFARPRHCIGPRDNDQIDSARQLLAR